MPPLATNVVDQEDVQLMANWINNYANVAPTIDTGSLTQTTISENTPVGTPLGSVTASDPDVRGGISDASLMRYTITSGNPNNIFAVDAVTGQITVNGILNFAISPQYVLQVTASDNFVANPKTATQTVTINLTQGTSNVDANHNGIPDAWENLYHLTGGPGKDTDHDGTPDFFEYLEGRDPTHPDQDSSADVHALGHVNAPATGYEYQWRSRNGLILGQNYYPQSSSDLKTWTTLQSTQYTVVSTVANGAGFSQITVLVPSAGGPQFFRLSSSP